MRTEVSSKDATRLASGLVRVIRRLETERDEAIRLAAWFSTPDVYTLGKCEPPDWAIEKIKAEIARRLAGREGEGE